MKKIVARPLHDFEIELTAPHQAVIKLTDDLGKTTAYAINPDGLGTILEQGFGLADGWSDHPDLLPETFCGPLRALPANLLTIERGRHDREVALRVRVGRLELAYMLPVDEVVRGFAPLVPYLEQDNPPPVH